MITSFTTFHRKVIQDMRGHQVSEIDGSGPDVITRFVGLKITEKNPLESRYPGFTVRIHTPRHNTDWNVHEDTFWFQEDPEDPAARIIKHSRPVKSFWIDYRISVHAKNQVHYDELVKLLYTIWDVGNDQTALLLPDPDDETWIHRIQVRLVRLADRFRPADNVFISDYLMTIPAFIITDTPVDEKPVEELEFNFNDEPTESFKYSIALDEAVAASAPADSDVTVQLIALDHIARPVANRPIVFAITGGTGSISTESGVTDSDGKISTVWTLGEAGINSLRATSTGADGSPINVSVVAT